MPEPVDNVRPHRRHWVLSAVAAMAMIVVFGLYSAFHSRSAKTPSQGIAPGAANAAALDLVGTVLSVEGKPVTNASVFILTARPRSGPGFL